MARLFQWPSALTLVSVMTSVWSSPYSDGLPPHLRYVTDSRLTSDVNLERYHIVEEDLLSNVEVLLRDDFFDAADGESEEEHLKHKPDLSSLESTVNQTRQIHQEAGKDIMSYLSHPVNVYHLVRRLQTQWRKSLDIVLTTRLCREWKVPGMVRHLRYVKERLPSDKDINQVIKFLANQQKMFGPEGEKVTSGQVGEQRPVQPLEVEDQFIIAKSLYQQENFQSALQWFESVNDWLTKAGKDEKEGLHFNLTSVLHKMATTYYQVKNPAASVTAVERLLEVDPSNRLAKSNLAFFRSKAEQQDQGDSESAKKVDKPKTYFERLCAGKATKLTRHRCVLEPVSGHRGWYFHKKEILRRNPPIFVYHDFISQQTAEQMRDYSFTTISDRSWTSDAFRAPRLRLLINYQFIHPLHLRKKIRGNARNLRRLPRPDPRIRSTFGPLQVFTSGLEGMHLSDYMDKLDLMPMEGEKDIGVFFLFLSESKEGGRVVMPRRHIALQPTKGSVLFYHVTRSTPHSFCPAIGGSVWTALQPVYYADPRQCSLRRKR